MSNKVMSWNLAIENGYNPSLYTYNVTDIPVGEYEAELQFKIWSKNIMGIGCYFIQKQTGKRFKLTVFRQRATKVYTLDSGGINFVETPVNCTYLIRVSKNEKNRIIFENAVLLSQSKH